MKPKKINDHRDSSDLRSNTPFSSSTRMNSARGRRSGKVTSAGGKILSLAATLDCHSVQYPDPASVKPTSAAAISTGTMILSRVMDLTSAPVFRFFNAESDNRTPLASILPDQMSVERAQLPLSCITIRADVHPYQTQASLSH